LFRSAESDDGRPPGPPTRTVELGIPGVHVEVGDHVCAFHRSGRGADVLIPYLRAGLAAQDKCICLVDAAESQAIKTVTGHLVGEGAAAEVWSPSESYLRDGEFRLARMMSFWEERVGSAVDHYGFEFVRSVGNMSWALDAKTDVRELVRYESELSLFLPRYPQVMLCLYDLDQFNGEVLVGILESHPLVLLAGMVTKNPYYIEPDKILSAAPRSAGLDSPQSRLHAVLVLAMLMAESVEEDKIIQLGVTAAPVVAACRAVGLFLVGEGRDVAPPSDLGSDALGALADQLLALAPHGGRVEITDAPWAWAFPLSSLGGRVGDLVVSAAVAPSEDEMFVLQALARQIGVAIAQARFQQGEARANEELRDSMTELERARAESQAARSAAEAASRAKSDFIAALSHELRTPLNAMVGFAQVLDMTEERPESDREPIRHILRAGRHIEELTDQILDIARIEAGRLDLAPTSIGWAEAAGDAISLVEPLATERGITLENRLPDMPNLHVVADKLRLRQVLLNLLSNAVKYNRDGGSVTVVVVDASDPSVAESSARGMVRILVRDTGFGIAADRLEGLFVPFDRLGAETSETPGAGLGLALSQGLVESMGGEMGVETTMGVGSTFWFDLPVAVLGDRDGAEAGVAAADPVPGVESRAALVVLVDDNEANLALLRRALALRPGFRLLCARDGADGIAVVSREIPDLVLLDLHLPLVDGGEVLRRLKAEPSTSAIPVVVLSGVTDADAIRRTLEDGADGYFTKPFDFHELIASIDRLLTASVPTDRALR
jgi:signal transduction histidine kinase/CheY-like chemotaxis protein